MNENGGVKGYYRLVTVPYHHHLCFSPPGADEAVLTLQGALWDLDNPRHVVPGERSILVIS